jgi:hypothetical protein
MDHDTSRRKKALNLEGLFLWRKKSPHPKMRVVEKGEAVIVWSVI